MEWNLFVVAAAACALWVLVGRGVVVVRIRNRIPTQDPFFLNKGLRSGVDVTVMSLLCPYYKRESNMDIVCEQYKGSNIKV